MKPLAQGGYTAAEVEAALRDSRVVDFRYERYDKFNILQGNFDGVIQGSVDHAALSDIKRTAKFSVSGSASVDYLNDRIMPYMRLKMGERVEIVAVDAAPPTYPELILMHDPVSFYRFEEGSGPTILDSSGNSHDGNLSGDVARVPGLIPDSGKGIALTTTLDQSGDGYGKVNNFPAQNGEFSVEAWVRPYNDANFDVNQAIAERAVGDNTNSDWLLYIEGGTGQFAFRVMSDDNSYNTVYTDHFTKGAIQHVVGVLSANVMRIYVDGVERNSLALVSPRNNYRGSASLWIGILATAQSYALNGDLDELAVYNRALTAEEIAQHYEKGLNQLKWTEDREVVVEDWAEWPLGLFLLSTPTRRSKAGKGDQRDIDAYDQTQVLLDDKVTDRLTISAGTTVTTAITGQLTAAGITRQNVSASAATLPNDRDWDPGTSRFQIINDLLDAINYAGVWFDSNGYAVCAPYVSPANKAPGFDYIDDAGSVSLADAESTLDLFAVPNMWVLIVSEPDLPVLRSVYTNTNPSSPTSTVSRGRTIVDYHNDVQAVDQTTLDAAAARMAYEASQVYETFTLNTALIPIHEHMDVINLAFGRLSTSGIYEEVGWSMDLVVGAAMQHTLRRLVTV